MRPIPRLIHRAAFLHDAEGRPEKLFDLLPEIAAKGYRAAGIFVFQRDADFVAAFCRRAAALKLDVWLMTGYMKYDEAYLAEHPDQRLVTAEDVRDQDGLSASSWGCPFNRKFKARYIAFLQRLAGLPGVTRLSLNDEAFLLSGCYCKTCRADYAREIGGEMPLKTEPKAEDWRDACWRAYLKWKMDRWNCVHGEMAAVIHAVNPRIKAVFQASPASDLWLNPWSTGVDLSGMIERLDGLSTDPYYTFHERHFNPAEVYLSEWCRFLRGIVPDEKEAEMVVQGFSHPTFTRPLGREDGYWSALVPLACGINQVTPYCYHFQKASPVQETYEACFKLDRYFAQVQPLKHAAIVHGAQTEIFARPLPATVPDSYDGTRVMPVAEALRHKGIPYAFLPDRRMDERSLSEFRVIVLPELDCLSDHQAAALRAYMDRGGNLVILGNLGSATETGAPRTRSFLEEQFGIRIREEAPKQRPFQLTAKHPALATLETMDEAGAQRYLGGAHVPIFALRHCVIADAPSDAEVLASFEDSPAILSLKGRGRMVWLAGFPTRTAESPAFHTTVLNRAHTLLPLLVEWVAGTKPALRVENWPPEVPMKRLRPFDQRDVSTFEFFPLEGEGGYLGLVTSYFKEPTAFPMTLQVPKGKRLKRVTELLSGSDVPFQNNSSEARIQVQIGHDTAALAFWFEMDMV
ncbi:MAG: hypothetical protein HY360_19820 [Verrucomicrobia bacterium]|nr:hypothetical protein [Verrucomicrobiota bacterium]